MIEKKNIFHYSITAINTLIAVFALYFAFSHNKQLTDVDFLWETSVAQYIPVKLEKEQTCPDNCEKIRYILPVWLEFKIVNTGFRAFSVDSISVLVFKYTLDDSNEIAYRFSGELTKQKNGLPTNEIIELPVVLEPGHSKEFLKRVRIPIPQNLYLTFKQKFKDGKIKILSFDKNDYLIFQQYKISSLVSLAGGQTKIAEVQIGQ